MTQTNTCPRCGSGPYGGTFSHNRYECLTITWMDNGQIIHESPQCKMNQLSSKLCALESAYAECSEKLHHSEQREHDLKRRLDDMRGQRDAFQSVVTNPHALWSNWLRGDIQLPAGIGDIRECAEKMKRFRSRWLAAHQELRKAENRIERAEQREHDLRRRLESTTNHTTP